MSTESLSELSYRELQIKAKEFSIPANQKKEVLIQCIQEAILGGVQQNFEGSNVIPDEEERSVALTSIPITPKASVRQRVTRSTAKKCALAAANEPVDNCENIENHAIKSTEEAPMKGGSSKKDLEVNIVREIETPKVNCDIESPTTIHYSDSTKLTHFTPTCDDGSVSDTDDDGELPEPVVLFEEPKVKMSVNRHIYFASPEMSTTVEGQGSFGNKHIYFASPEAEAAHIQSNKENSVDDALNGIEKLSIGDSKSSKDSKFSPGHNDRVMSFWLTKGFGNPMGNILK